MSQCRSSTRALNNLRFLTRLWRTEFTTVYEYYETWRRSSSSRTRIKPPSEVTRALWKSTLNERLKES